MVADQTDRVALRVLHKGHPLIHASRSQTVVGVAEDHVRLRLDLGARYTTAQIFGAPAWRTELLAAWLLGFLLYHWLHEPPLGPSWWVDIVEETGQPNLGIGASLPSFAASFVLALVFGSLGSRLPEPASKW